MLLTSRSTLFPRPSNTGRRTSGPFPLPGPGFVDTQEGVEQVALGVEC